MLKMCFNRLTENGSLEIVKNDDGQFWWPGIANNLGPLELTEGYKVFLEDPCEWRLEGITIDADSLVFEVSGNQWNYIGYPFNWNSLSQDAWGHIVDQFLILQNDDGQFWWPGLGMNTIEYAQSGVGYRMYASEDFSFHYQDLQFIPRVNPEVAMVGPSDERITPSGLPYVVHVRFSDDLWNSHPERIELFDGERLVGSGRCDQRSGRSLCHSVGG